MKAVDEILGKRSHRDVCRDVRMALGMSKKRRYIEKPNPFTASLFGQHFHRWPNASYSLVYAMACVEVVANSSEEAGIAYQEIVAAWGAPGLKRLFDSLIGAAPAADVEELKDTLRHPEKGFLPDPDKPFREIAALYSGERLNKELTEDEQRSLLEKFENEPQFADAKNLLELIYVFIIAGFNREKDLEEGICRVDPISNPHPHAGILLARSSLMQGLQLAPPKLEVEHHSVAGAQALCYRIRGGRLLKVTRLPRITGKEAERALLRAGWYVHHSRGSHFYYKHPDFHGKRVDIPIHAGERLAPKTLKSILEQANLSVDDFVDLLRGG